MEPTKTEETVVPRENRPKVMLATRRRRLGSMPSRFAQTDEELEVDEARRLARTSNSLQIPGFTYRDRVTSEDMSFTQNSLEFCFNFLDEEEAVCHSPVQSPLPWSESPDKRSQRTKVGFNLASSQESMCLSDLV